MSALVKFDFIITLFLLFSVLQIRISEGQVLTEYDCTGNISGVCRSPEDCMKDFMYKCPIPGSPCCPEFIGNTTTEDLDNDFDDEMVNNMTRSAKRGSGCRIRPDCERRGGYCVTNNNQCDGTLLKKLCKGPKCSCCIPINIPGTCPITGKPGVHCSAPQSCAGYGNNLHGVYEICPVSNCPPVEVRCMDDGWTVVLYRDLALNKSCNFARDWGEYKEGFCKPSGEHWIGNDVVAYLTAGSGQYYQMEITGITSSGNRRTLKYSHFYVHLESYNYYLSVYGYDESSTGPDLFYSPPNANIALHGKYFTTYDRDNDNLANENCCSRTGRGGWWYNSCSGIVPTKNSEILWYFWNEDEYGPKEVERLHMKIKPQD